MAKLKENSKIVKVSGEELIATEPKVLSMIQDNAYVLPTASSSILGGIKVGSRLSISGGKLSADKQTDNNFTNVLKTKLDGIESGADEDGI